MLSVSLLPPSSLSNRGAHHRTPIWTRERFVDAFEGLSLSLGPLSLSLGPIWTRERFVDAFEGALCWYSSR